MTSKSLTNLTVIPLKQFRAETGISTYSIFTHTLVETRLRYACISICETICKKQKVFLKLWIKIWTCNTDSDRKSKSDSSLKKSHLLTVPYRGIRSRTHSRERRKTVCYNTVHFSKCDEPNGKRDKTCRFSVVLEDLPSLLVTAPLFYALTLHVTLFHFLKQAVGSPVACEDLVGILGVKEDCVYRDTTAYQYHVASSGVIFTGVKHHAGSFDKL